MPATTSPASWFVSRRKVWVLSFSFLGAVDIRFSFPHLGARTALHATVHPVIPRTELAILLLSAMDSRFPSPHRLVGLSDPDSN